MNIVYFMTFDYSLKTWSESAALDRETKYFNYLSEKYGFKFYIVTYGSKDDLKYSNQFSNATVIPIYEHFRKSNFTIINFFKSFTYCFSIKKLIQDEKFIIKQNQLLGSWVAWTLKLITGSRLFIRTGYDMYTFSKYDKKSFLKVLLYKLLTRVSLLYADIYSVSSEEDIKILNSTFRTNKIVLIRNWVEVVNSKDISSRENKILSIGRLEYQKNFQYLVDNFKNSDKKITIYGKGSEEHEIKSLAKQVGLDLEIVNNINNEDLISKLNSSKYFIQTSLFEGNPKALLEAMSAGCIVLASNIANNSEIINDGENGFLFDLNKNQLKNKFDFVDSLNLDQLEDISTKAKKTIKEQYEIDKIASLEINLLEELYYE